MDNLEPMAQACIVCGKSVNSEDKNAYIIIEVESSKYYKDSVCMECVQGIVNEWLTDWSHYK